MDGKILRTMIDEKKFSECIVDCLKDEYFCQKYCLFLLSDSNTETYKYYLSRAKVLKFDLNHEFVLFPKTYYEKINYLNLFIKLFLTICEFHLDEKKIFNIIMSRVFD